jgi:hypothetical protein
MAGAVRCFLPLAAFLLSCAAHAERPRPEPPFVEPLPAEAIGSGCGCTFYSSRSPREDSRILRWTEDDRGHAVMKLDGAVRRLGLVQEKRLPEARTVPRYADRLVLILRDDVYQVEVASSVKRTCRPRVANCGSAGYVAKLIIRRGAEAWRELRGWGECGC